MIVMKMKTKNMSKLNQINTIFSDKIVGKESHRFMEELFVIEKNLNKSNPRN